MVLSVRVIYYYNDYNKRNEVRNFSSLEELKRFLKREFEKYGPSATSRWWKNPADGYKDAAGNLHAWFNFTGFQEHPSFWIKEVLVDGKTIIYSKSNYCSPKFYDFINSLHDEIENGKPVYGDI